MHQGQGQGTTAAGPTRADTHAADEVPPQAPPPPSRPPKQKHETPDQFWTNTLKHMKERKSLQYQKLAAAAFYIYIYIYIYIYVFLCLINLYVKLLKL
jgi:hypothetical protein